MTSPSPLPTGSPAPRFTLAAIGSQRPFRLADLRGREVLLLFVDRHNARTARELVEQIRRQQPDHEALTIALVIDLHAVPKVLRGTAEHFIEGLYHQSAALIPAPYDPADHLILLSDWTGQLFAGYRIDQDRHEMAAVLVDDRGLVVAVIHDPATPRKVLALVNERSNGSPKENTSSPPP